MEERQRIDKEKNAHKGTKINPRDKENRGRNEEGEERSRERWNER